MAQQNLNGVQVGAGFQHVRRKAVAEYVGIHLLLDPRTASGVLAGVARRFSIDGLITTMPAVSGESQMDFLRKRRQCARSPSSRTGLSITSRSSRPLPPWM